MAETLTPISTTTIHNQIPSLAAPIQCPKSPFFLGSNNDQLERAQARAAVFRRKAVEFASPPPPPPHLPLRPSISSSSKSCLNRDQIIERAQARALTSTMADTKEDDVSAGIVYLTAAATTLTAAAKKAEHKAWDGDFAEAAIAALAFAAAHVTTATKKAEHKAWDGDFAEAALAFADAHVTTATATAEF